MPRWCRNIACQRYGEHPAPKELKLSAEPKYSPSRKQCMKIPFPNSLPIHGIMQFSIFFPNEENACLRLLVGWNIFSHTSHLYFLFLICFSIFLWSVLHFYCCLQAFLLQSRCLVCFALKITSVVPHCLTQRALFLSKQKGDHIFTTL